MEFEVNKDELGIYPLYEVFYIECILSATESAINSLEEIDFILSDSKLLNDIGLKIIDLSENIINKFSKLLTLLDTGFICFINFYCKIIFNWANHPPSNSRRIFLRHRSCLTLLAKQ